MQKIKLKQFNRKTIAAFLFSAFLITIITSVVGPTTAYAAEPEFRWQQEADPRLLEDVRYLYSLLDCLSVSSNILTGDPAFYSTLSGAQVDSFDIFSEPNKKINVGYDLSTSTGQLTCKQIGDEYQNRFEELAGSIGSNRDFIKFFYTELSNGTFKPKNGVSPEFANALGNQVFQSPDLRKAQIAVNSAQCLESVALSGPYEYRDGKTATTPIAVSRSLQADRSFNCETLASLRRSEAELWLTGFNGVLENQDTITLGVLRNNPHFLYQAISVKAQTLELKIAATDDLLAVFTATPGILDNCLTTAGIDRSTILPVHYTVATLLTGDITDIDNDGNEVKEELLTTCIKDGYGGFVTNILDELNEKLAETDASPVANSSASSSTADSDTDKCLEGDSILGWVVCPIIEKIQSTLGVLEGYIGSMLKFDLANVQGEGGTGGDKSQKEIRESWNIFRSLASILIIIGFLTALTVKAIRGE